MKTLILGSNHYETATAYNSFGLDPSVLVDDINIDYTVGHTSRQEFRSDKELEMVLKQADRVLLYLIPAHHGSKSEFYTFLEWVNEYHSKHRNVSNLNEVKLDPYHWNMRPPTLSPDDAVFIGCSFTAGIGLSSVDEMFSTLVSKHYRLNCVNLGCPGGSNSKIFEVFSSLEFHPGQLVVVQLTMPCRIQYCDEETRSLIDIILGNTPPNISKKKYMDMVNVFNQCFLLHETVLKLRMVINLARQKQLKFVFWLINYKNDLVYSQEDQMYFYEYPEFIPKHLMQNYLVDFGSDNLHPGAESNKIIADAIIKHVDRLYYEIDQSS